MSEIDDMNEPRVGAVRSDGDVIVRWDGAAWVRVGYRFGYSDPTAKPPGVEGIIAMGRLAGGRSGADRDYFDVRSAVAVCRLFAVPFDLAVGDVIGAKILRWRADGVAWGTIVARTGLPKGTCRLLAKAASVS